MHFCLGSLNPVKKEALIQALKESGRFSSIHVSCENAPSGVPDQPRGFESTLTGARNRAKAVWHEGIFMGVGIESGIVPVPLTRTGFMNLTACVFYNGREYFTGLGPAFELPTEISRLVSEEGLELDAAVQAAGFSKNPRIGYSEGLIGILTGNAVTRMDYTKPAIHMALAALC
ncbi:inosine/xanthosine triphosphatase [Desulfobotulus alkaliphilus]|uniref:inosine/xanthosine triphosphatase n=1 Tax=Desulfobotulus alkaliphilus TaxID=622671 RepID=A0A562RN44_9BACT|nr:inosine/xanthosine triphosphatase [Desulfobotulus alkaliphilus]TWI70293.1 inosine/xanthosine triphosphatase [Desulfobotulus alkaliphilus]